MAFVCNVSKVDPTRTSSLRNSFVADVNRRFTKVAQAIIQLVGDDDAFGLTVNYSRWQFMNTPQQLAAFKLWLANQIDNHVYDNKTAAGDDWMYHYVHAGYRKGQERAFADARKPALWRKKMDFYAGTREQFLMSSFSNPVSVNKVKVLASRVFSELEGITEAMSQKIVRELIDGLTQGQSPRQIAITLAQSVQTIGKARAQALARTEIIRSHAEGQLDALEDLGVESVGAAIEFSTAGDMKVCKKCSKLNGIVLKIKEARGLIPFHPNCRCAWIPANVGEKSKTQKKSYNSIKSALESALNRKRTKGQNAKYKLSRKRPKAIV